MITITLNTPLKIDTGEAVSSVIVLLERYEIREDVDSLRAHAQITMYRSIEDAIDRFRPVWLLEIPQFLQTINSILTAGQYANVDLDAIQGIIVNILEDGDSAGQWQARWDAWGGLLALDPLNTVVKSMPAAPDAAPTAMTATLNGSNVDIAWSEAATNEFGFVIERSLTTVTGFVQIARVGYGVEAYTDIDVPEDPDIEYFYRVAAWNNAGLSAYTAEDSITTPA